MRSTVLRLERRAAEQGQALEHLQLAYEELATAVLEAAAARGYLGRDPLGAVGTLLTPAAADVRVGQVAMGLWQTFFGGFRPDEASFELERFREAAAGLEERLIALQPGEVPDPALALALLESLLVLWEERQDTLNERIDLLIKELDERQRQLGSADLAKAWREDEMERATAVMKASLAELGEQVPDGAPFSELLSAMVKRWRHEIGRRSQELRALRSLHNGFRGALMEAAAGKGASGDGLDEHTAKIVSAVVDLVAANREQDRLLRDLEREQAEHRAEVAQLQAEVAARDQLLARYEFADGPEENDRRLALYRQAVAALSAGKDASAYLEEIREIERVFLITERAQEQALSLLDRHLDGLHRSLLELRRIANLTDDPRRFRPRLLGSSPYKLKTLMGVIQASRDAGRDLLSYVGRARWAAGVQQLANDGPKLRAVFTEMVRLVGDCREKVGGPPPASITIDLGSTQGLATLPAVLAADLRSLLRARGIATTAGALQGLLEDCVAVLHRSLEQARGEPIPRAEPPKRESAIKALARLSEELLALSGLLETVFAEARQRAWTLAPEEQELLRHEHLMVLGLRDLDAACEVLAALDGAPQAAFAKVPSGSSRRSELDKVLQGARERIAWLEEVARYRIELRPE